MVFIDASKSTNKVKGSKTNDRTGRLVCLDFVRALEVIVRNKSD
jgi:hypothetical protein